MRSSSSLIFAAARSLALWVGAMAWHLWRIGLGRPDFVRMSDSKVMALSFIAVYFLAGLVRHVVFGEYGLAQVGLSLCLWLGLMLIVAERPHRSSSLVAALLGVSAVVDLAIVVIELVGFDPSSSVFPSVVEVLLYLRCWERFFKCSPSIRQRGYSYRAESGHSTSRREFL